MKVWIDRDGCISCGQCVETCPEVFVIGDDGLAEAVRQPDADCEDAAQTAADCCPVSVIHTEE